MYILHHFLSSMEKIGQNFLVFRIKLSLTPHNESRLKPLKICSFSVKFLFYCQKFYDEIIEVVNMYTQCLFTINDDFYSI